MTPECVDALKEYVDSKYRLIVMKLLDTSAIPTATQYSMEEKAQAQAFLDQKCKDYSSALSEL